MSIPFGTGVDGRTAGLHTLDDGAGLVVRVSDHGATIVALHAPDRAGTSTDLALGFDDVAGYRSPENPYFGATIGRVANRIGGASFALDGHHYELAANEPPNHLHGGAARSFDKVDWEVVSVSGTTIELRYTSADGEEGYPGRVVATATYRVADRQLWVEYVATTDRPSPINMTNHVYLNLSGAGNGTVRDHIIQVQADSYTPTDDALIPTGEVRDVAGTPLDLREPVRVGDRIDQLLDTAAGGFDHNLVLRGRPGSLRPAARIVDPDSGRGLELATNQPALQLYTGNGLDPPIVGKQGRLYERFGAFCLEPQHHPDAVHHANFPSIIIRPGETYRHLSTYRFTTDG